MWTTFLQDFSAETFFRHVEPPHEYDVILGSDASKKGYGGYLGSAPIAGLFPAEWSVLDIQTLELYPILALIGTFSSSLRNKSVLIRCDNQSLVHCLNKFSSRNRSVLHLLRILVLILLRNNIAIKATHLSSEANYICDTLSRRQVSGSWLVKHGLKPKLAQVDHRFRPSALRTVLTAL